MKNTLYTVLAALMVSTLGGIGAGLVKAQSALNQLSLNTQALTLHAEALANIGTAMELRGIDRAIDGKQAEMRSNDVKIATNPDNKALTDVLRDQNTKLGQEITTQQAIRVCVVDPTKKVCK
jgi:hypothetical protein